MTLTAELPLEVEEFLSWLVAERGRAANTIAAYRRDLAAYHQWLTEHGTSVGSVDASALGEYTDTADVVVLVVVHPGTGDAAPTANLLAPVLVDRRTGRAVQSVLDEDWPLRAPVG